MRPETSLKAAAERAAAEVYEMVRAAAESAARQAVQDVAKQEFGVDIRIEDVDLDDRVTQAEAARRLNTSPPTIDRLRKKGMVQSEKRGNQVFVSLRETDAALRRDRRIEHRSR